MNVIVDTNDANVNSKNNFKQLVVECSVERATEQPTTVLQMYTTYYLFIKLLQWFVREKGYSFVIYASMMVFASVNE